MFDNNKLGEIRPNQLITTFGLFRNKYSGVFTNVVTLDELFG